MCARARASDALGLRVDGVMAEEIMRAATINAATAATTTLDDERF